MVNITTVPRNYNDAVGILAVNPTEPLTFTQNAHKTPQSSTAYFAYRHSTNYSHLGPKSLWTQIIHFRPFRVLVQKGACRK